MNIASTVSQESTGTHNFQEVDEKLTKVTRDILGNEATHLDILAQVDDIRGLLINSYF